MKRLMLLLVLLPAAAAGQDYVTPQIPTEEQKKAALLLAYKINGNSMVRSHSLGSIDLTQPIPVTSIRIPAAEVMQAMPKAVDKPVQKAEAPDTCARHGMHKVVTGSSWRCRK